MNHSLHPGVFFALVILAGLIAGSYWFTRKQSRPLRRPQPRVRTGRVTAPLAANDAPSAITMKANISGLLASNAMWPQIIIALNPGNSQSFRAELERIRGPHMFVPATALQVMYHGCEEVLRKSPNASALSALTAARASMEKVTRYGD